MSPLNRREFLKRGSLAVVAAGVVTVVPAAVPALAAAPSSSDHHAAEDVATGGHLDQPLIAHVRDLESGEITLFYGDQELTYRDRRLAAQLHRAAR